MTDNAITVTAAAHPFKVANEVRRVTEGQTLAEMLAEAQVDPVLRRHAVIFIAGHVIERRYWHVTRPKAGAHVEIKVLPSGGGGGGGGQKNVLRTVLTLAVIAASFTVPGLLFTKATLAGELIGSLTVGQALQGGIARTGPLLVVPL